MTAAGPAGGAELVWIDTDPAVGEPGRDVDDGYALLQALRSPELKVAAISTVFGNAPRAVCDRVAAKLLNLADAGDVPLHSGASGPAQLGSATAASDALAGMLNEISLTVLALGPLTNIATVILKRPDLVTRIKRVVFVGGRRPGQRFTVGARGPLPDFNLECDPAAAELVLATGVPLTLAGFEVSTSATLTPADLDLLAGGPPAARWLADQSREWCHWWADHLNYSGFHPFDTLAVAAVATPPLITVEAAAASLVATEAQPPGNVELQVSPAGRSGRPVDYASRAAPEFVGDLIRRLLSDGRHTGRRAPAAQYATGDAGAF